ncbi:hypothetical protein BT63DRAFT_456348 [Microthyrium microscopicum]|uniref:Aminoglycoside phosphotransferase domain-containing protein n=1 Tax=Microthyrium microscopicum TaxID=703497 RepID=A0A6A6U8X9_9PEZI|nr:hypothetical protein BT63DRAFT_456348 [Microthyrium microscopicum]
MTLSGKFSILRTGASKKLQNAIKKAQGSFRKPNPSEPVYTTYPPATSCSPIGQVKPLLPPIEAAVSPRVPSSVRSEQHPQQSVLQQSDAKEFSPSPFLNGTEDPAHQPILQSTKAENTSPTPSVSVTETPIIDKAGLTLKDTAKPEDESKPCNSEGDISGDALLKQDIAQPLESDIIQSTEEWSPNEKSADLSSTTSRNFVGPAPPTPPVSGDTSPQNSYSSISSSTAVSDEDLSCAVYPGSRLEETARRATRLFLHALLLVEEVSQLAAEQREAKESKQLPAIPDPVASTLSYQGDSDGIVAQSDPTLSHFGDAVTTSSVHGGSKFVTSEPGLETLPPPKSSAVKVSTEATVRPSIPDNDDAQPGLKTIPSTGRSSDSSPELSLTDSSNSSETQTQVPAQESAAESTKDIQQDSADSSEEDSASSSEDDSEDDSDEDSDEDLPDSLLENGAIDPDEKEKTKWGELWYIKDKEIRQLLSQVFQAKAIVLDNKPKGSFNRVFIAVVAPTSPFADPFKVAVRVNIRATKNRWTAIDAFKLEQQARTSNWIWKTYGLAPQVHAYDSGFDNVLGRPFTIMQCINGQSIQSQWYRFVPGQEVHQSLDLKRKHIMESLAIKVSRLGARSFNAAGTLYFPDDESEPQVGPYFHEGDHEINILPEFSPSFASFGDRLADDWARMEMRIPRGENNTVEQRKQTGSLWLISAIMKTIWPDFNEQAYYRRTEAIRQSPQPFQTPAQVMAALHPLTDGAQQENFKIKHNDLDAQNIMLDENLNVVCLYDWDTVDTVNEYVSWASYPLWLRYDWRYQYKERVCESHCFFSKNTKAHLERAQHRGLPELSNATRYTRISHVMSGVFEHLGYHDASSLYWLAERILCEALPKTSSQPEMAAAYWLSMIGSTKLGDPRNREKPEEDRKFLKTKEAENKIFGYVNQWLLDSLKFKDIPDQTD